MKYTSSHTKSALLSRKYKSAYSLRRTVATWIRLRLRPPSPSKSDVPTFTATPATQEVLKLLHQQYALYYTPSTFKDFATLAATPLDSSMVLIACDWILELMASFKFHRSTCHCALNYFQRALHGGILRNRNARQHLQLVAVACMLIASKVEEVGAPSVNQYVECTDNAYTIAQIVSMEREILTLLQWNLHPPTLMHWLSVFWSELLTLSRDSDAELFHQLNQPHTYMLCGLLLDYSVVHLYSGLLRNSDVERRVQEQNHMPYLCAAAIAHVLSAACPNVLPLLHSICGVRKQHMIYYWQHEWYSKLDVFMEPYIRSLAVTFQKEPVGILEHTQTHCDDFLQHMTQLACVPAP